MHSFICLISGFKKLSTGFKLDDDTLVLNFTEGKKVGINVTTPNSELNVSGDMRVSGNLIIEKFPQYNKEDFLMVGDSDVDSTFARKLGIKCIIVKF